MSCCNCSCPIQPCPSKYAAWLLRIGFGVALAGYGVNHYRNLEAFVGLAQGVFPTYAAVGTVAMVLAYIVPILEIVGGVAFMFGGKARCIAKIGIFGALGGIVGWAGFALMIENPDLAIIGGAIQNAFMFLVAYYVIKKMTCCRGSCPTTMPGSMRK